VIATKIQAMEGAYLWDGITDKLSMLDRGDGSKPAAAPANPRGAA
jgi:hypothetical protein